MGRALIVTDMLAGFLEEGKPLYCGDDARKIIPFVRDKVEEFVQAGEPVIFIADSHAPDDAEFKMFPPHCVAGTDETELVEELIPFKDKGTVVPKTRYSSFHNTTLAQLLTELDPDVVEVVGVCTNICVLYTVEELRNRDYSVVVHRQGVASFDKAAHEFAIGQMKDVLGAEIR
jgi:nicotinamidase/pyrazinamidase